MPPRNFAAIRPLLVLLLALLFVPASRAAAAEEPEILKGTVKSLEEGVLHLKDVRFEDETLPPREIRVLTDRDTAWFDGPVKIGKESIVPDLRVLVRCILDGRDRKALLVRIVGGKKPE